MKYYHSELNPKERILKVIEDYLKPFLEKEDFKFLKSQNMFKKNYDFFEYHISFYNNRYNHGNETVEFEIYINILSPKYKKWEKSFYGYENKIGGTYIDGGNANGFKNWSEEFLEANWYSLVENDNEKLINRIKENIQNVALPYFNKFKKIDSTIEELLKNNNDGNFLLIFDLLIMENNFDSAITFFEKNNQWFESELAKKDDESYFGMNYKRNYLVRKKEYEKIKNSH
jgi:hypothetical protein